MENNPDTAFFTIHGKTGQILTKEVLDHEAKNRYLFSVVARDGGTPPRGNNHLCTGKILFR